LPGMGRMPPSRMRAINTTIATKAKYPIV